MLKSTVRFAVFGYAFWLSTAFSGRMLGPGFIIFKSFEHCDPPVTELNLWLTQRKLNRTTDVIDMTLSTPWPLSDKVTVEIKALTKRDGGYKPGSFYMKGPFCKTLRTLAGDLFDEILSATGVEDCPIPGDVKVDGFYIDSDKLNDQVLYGDYKIELIFYIDDKVIGCYLLYVNIVPKED